MAAAAEKTRRQRAYDVIVWGASGYTGRLVAEYLMHRYGSEGDLRWAIAGRDRSKLDPLASALDPRSQDLPIIIADAHDGASLRRLAAETRVVLSTVGPYAKYGSALVEACAVTGTDYCDLAGEVQWMREMIDRFQHQAERSGARIVHSCGFDSIPSDIGVWFLQRAAKERHGQACNEVRLLVKAMKGGASGGTFASMMNAIEESRRNPFVARILRDPYALNPADGRGGPDGRDQSSIGYENEIGGYTAPFIMASVNTRVVRRTNALLGYAYGRDFKYSEAVLTGKGARGWIYAAGTVAGLSGFLLAASLPFSRSLLANRFLPKPSQGPTREQRESGFFRLILIGTPGDGSVLKAEVKGDRDPGYGSTSKMLGESAVCLARDALTAGGGFWTPASAMGDALLARLVANAGLSFDIVQ